MRTLLYELDTDGYIIELQFVRVERDEDENTLIFGDYYEEEVEAELPEYWTIDELPDGFHEPRWDGTTWVEGKNLEDILGIKKEIKKFLISQMCHDEIVSGFTQVVNGERYKFSYDMEAQTNFQEAYQLFQNQVIDEITWSARLEEESVRLTFNKHQFESLFYSSVKHKQELISKLKDKIEPLIKSAETEEELDNIAWNVEDPKELAFRLNRTMDRELGDLNLRTEMSDMALMEIANMVMGL